MQLALPREPVLQAELAVEKPPGETDALPMVRLVHAQEREPVLENHV